MIDVVEIFAEAQFLQDEIVRHRRILHQNPELSFQEHSTSAHIQTELNALGIPFAVMGETGVVALLGQGKRCVGLRADIDALPITEDTGLPFASDKPGVMHACGHDAHTAMLLAAARILKKHENELCGQVKIIFQPGEEKVPGGASILIREGVLDSPRVEVMFGQHVFPQAQTGSIHIRDGYVMASADELYWTIRGTSAHAAQPHLGKDPIYVSSAIIQHLQSILTTTKNPLDAGQLIVTSIHGGTATNIIPDSVEMKGTLRSFNSNWRELAITAIENHSAAIAALHGCISDTVILRGYPPVYNNPAETDFSHSLATALIGNNNVIEFEPKLWGEDFGFYAQTIPSVFWFLGVSADIGGNNPGLHHPQFNLDESALWRGAGLLAAHAIEWLQTRQ